MKLKDVKLPQMRSCYQHAEKHSYQRVLLEKDTLQGKLEYGCLYCLLIEKLHNGEWMHGISS